MENSIQYDETEEQKNLSTQERVVLLKRRIEEMKRTQTVLYVGQAEATQTDDECYAEIMAACEKFLHTDSEEDEINLAKTLEKHNLQLYYYPPNTQEFTDVQNAVARIAFDGVLPPLATLRPSNRDVVMGNSQLKGKVVPEDYDFTRTQWEVFRQIPELAQLEDKLRNGLAKKGIDPADLPKLKVHDYLYILDGELRKYPEQRCVKVMQESYKARNTKRFINEYEKEFREGLMALPGIKKDYVDALISAMKQGRTDVTKHRENGVLVWKEEWADQPVINVHHIVNVKDSSNLELKNHKWYDVNNYENMCFIVTYPQHKAMHALEKAVHNIRTFEDRKKIGKKGWYRIQPPPGVKCMLSFHNMIYDRDYLKLTENEKSKIKQMSENNPNRRSGSRVYNGNPKNNSLKDRRDWHNKRTDYVKY